MLNFRNNLKQYNYIILLLQNSSYLAINMNFEERRLQTFQNWPANAAVESQRVAKAGFFYTGEGLTVECFSCGGRISDWDYGDQVMARHRILNPACPFVKKPTDSGNVPLLSTSSSSYRSVTSQSSVDSVQNVSLVSPTNSSLENCAFNMPNNLTSPSSIASIENINPTESSSTSLESHSLSGPVSNSEVSRQSENNSSICDGTLFRSEAARLETFRTWPISSLVSPQQLAKAGFYFLQEEDKVKCAFCGGVVGHWEAGDDPDREHRRHFPSCPLHYNIPVGNIPLNTTTVAQNNICDNVIVREVHPSSTLQRPEQHSKSLPENSDALVEGVQQHRGPRHPKYSTVESRLRTFKEWPGNYRQTPQQLAQAGFYYTGVRDQVRCFHCDGGLRQWNDTDDPWVEHARWFSKCVYIVLMKGEDFIQQVAAQHPPILESHIKQDGREQTSINQPQYKVRNVSEQELDGLMNTLAAQIAVEMGLDVPKIRSALRKKVEQTGLPFTTCDALIGTVLDMSSNSSGTRSPVSPVQGPSYESIHSSSSCQQNAPFENEIRDRGGQENAPAMKHHVISKAFTSSQSTPNISQKKNEERGVISSPNVDICSSGAHTGDNSDLLAEENRKLKEARLCKICMDEEVGVVFLPCGHLVTCVNCTSSLQDCPLCRQPIKATVRTFLS